MRIISGKYKGRILSSFNADHLRPTMDRVKETIFNKWMHYIDDASVLDLFAGTGNLGIEALSRGALRVTSIEKNLKSVQIINSNLKLLDISEEDYILKKMDVFSFLKNEKENKFDLIFVDPPFTEKLAHDVMLALNDSLVLKPDTRVVIESIKQERIDKDYGIIKCYDQINYGDKYLSFFST